MKLDWYTICLLFIENLLFCIGSNTSGYFKMKDFFSAVLKFDINNRRKISNRSYVNKTIEKVTYS